MNKTLIATIVAIVVVGGGLFFLFGGNDNNADVVSKDSSTMKADESMSEETNDDTVPESFTGNLKQLLAFGKNLTCTFTQNDESVDGSGTVYISGDRMRGDFAMNLKQGEGAMRASTIQKDGTMYSWGVTPYGNFSTKLAIQESHKNSKSEGFDFNENLDYNCNKWIVDNSKFELPKDVNFDDISVEVNQINAATDDIRDLQCSACDQVPDASAKAQCLASLGC